MIVVSTALISANTGIVTELARMRICNVGGDQVRRDYRGETFIGRSTRDLDRGRISREGAVSNWPSEQVHVWNLVAAMLGDMRYGK